MSVASEREPSKERVILVHGTGASSNSDDGTTWWQRRSPLWQRLESRGFVVEAFIWSGANDEIERRSAGAVLQRRLQELAKDGARVHIVGHSHGGSVIWHALHSSNEATTRAVLSCCTVGTPFLHYGLRLDHMVQNAAMLIACAAALLWATSPVRDISIKYAVEGKLTLEAMGWLTLFVLPLALLFCSARALWPFVKELVTKRSKNCQKVERNTHLCLWSSQDEPILGLAASGSFGIRVLRTSPANAGGVASFINGLLIAATNQFCNNLFSRALQGSSIDHLELKAGTTWPMPELAQKPLPRAIDLSLIRDADKHAARFGRRIRRLLVSGKDPVTGWSDLQKAAGTTLTFKELVHTTYFQSDACVELILSHIDVCAGRPHRLQGPALAFYENRFSAPAHTQAAALPSNDVRLVSVLRQLDWGELKGRITDRIRWVPGPPAEVRLVRRIFESYAAEGWSVRTVVEMLGREGIAAADGTAITQRKVEQLLQCEAVIGNFVWGRSNRTARAERMRRRPQDARITRAESVIEPIVGRDPLGSCCSIKKVLGRRWVQPDARRAPRATAICSAR
jgi:pimeloyl-ACP methyl ester carboxylesterase